MKTESPTHVWNSVLEITEDIGCDEIKAVRVLLYMVLLDAGGTTARDRLRCFRDLWRHLARPLRDRFPESAKGHPLFAFVYNDAANVNNLVPVFQAARKTCDGIAVLSGDTVTIRSLDLNHADSHIGVAGLAARTTAKERFNALLESMRLYWLLLGKFSQRDAHQAATIRANRARILTDLARSLALRPALRRLYAKWQPSCLISTTDLWPFEHAAFVEARRAGIPSFVIQHGLTNICWQPFECDFLLLWGESFRQELLALGAPPERLVVCGMPAADHLFLRYRGKTARPSARQPLSILILSQTHAQSLFGQLFAQYRSLLIDIIPTNADIRWLVKLHPNETGNFYRDLGNDVLRHLTILPKSTTLEQAVADADVASTLYSTAGLEAMMMGCPLIVFDVAPAISEFAWWPKHGGGVYVSTVDAMSHFITRAKESASFLHEIVAKQHSFLQANFANQGRAADSVISVISRKIGKATLIHSLLPQGQSAAQPLPAPDLKKPSFYRPELDCLRFFAFLAVFVHHSIPKTTDFYVSHHLPTFIANFPYAGAFGVDLFFCLSAYLITELLLREKDKIGHLNVKAFYARRMLRIWPLYFFFVIFAYGLTFIDHAQRFSAIQFVMFLLLMGNWAELTGSAIQSCVAPLWSVSIEEQFYLLWPLVVRKASRKRIVQICFGLIGVAFVWRSIIQTHLNAPHLMIWNGTFSHLDTISYGILVSVIGVKDKIPGWSRTGLVLAGLTAWVFAASLRERGDAMMALVAVGSVAILRASIGLNLKHRYLVRLGMVSYGLYVYHEFFLDRFNGLLPNTHGWWGYITWWVLSLGSTMLAALVSYRLLESPFLKLKEKFTVVKSRPV